MDRAVAAASLLLTSPVILVRALEARRRTGRVFEPVDVIGQDGKPFRLWTFAGDARGSSWLHLVNVVRGEMRFVGPRPLLPQEAAALEPDQHWRLDGRPGIFSTHRLQQLTGIAYEEEDQLDRALLADQSLANRANLGIVARSLVAGLLGGSVDYDQPPRFRLLDVAIANTTMSKALDWIFDRAQAATAVGDAAVLCFVNPGCLNIAVEDEAYRAVLDRADLVLPDGIGIKLATRLHHVGLTENVNGTDMFPRLCARAAHYGVPLYLLGARDGVAADAAKNMVARYPGLVIAGTHHGYFAQHEDEIIEEINASGARVLLVAMGVPQQELWIARVRHRLAPGVVMGVGGLFDFYSGRIPRAPLWLREIGLEWSWRLAQEPRRMWRRYVIGHPVFLYRVWRRRDADAAADAATRSPG